jgi:hypothetical protein
VVALPALQRKLYELDTSTLRCFESVQRASFLVDRKFEEF